jgi:signal transduction histidine kinase
MTEADAHERFNPVWDAYFAVTGGAITVAVLAADHHALWRRFVAVAAIVAMAVVHVAFGRRIIRRDIGYRPAIAATVAQVALFGVAVFAVPFTTWLLFAVSPLIFQMVPWPAAVPLVIATNAIPVIDSAVEDPAGLPMSLIIAVVSGGGGLWLGWWTIQVIEQSEERGRLIEQLEASRAEVARLSHEAGVGAERARLAGEIHDTLAQGFTSIITLLQAADPQLRDERLALAVRTAKENLAEARALVSALSPVALESGSLPDSVRRQAGRFSEETGVPATVRVTGAERALPTSVQVVLLRTTQEALTNVRRHAAAGSAQVQLAYSDREVRLTVRDDGRGFTPGDADGFGLTGMRARAEQVNGTLTVASTTGAGTTIELEVPS